MKEEKNSKVLIAVVVILLVSVIVLSVFIVYDKILKNNDVDSASNNSNNQNVTNLQVTDEDVKNIYEDIMQKQMDKVNDLSISATGFGYDPLLNLYSEKENILDSYFDYDTKMDLAFDFAYRNNKVDIKVVNKDDIYSINTVKVSDIKGYYGQIFGKDKEIVIKDFDSYSSGKCKVSSENYVCEQPIGGGESTPEYILMSFEKYQTDNDSLYIYENVIYYVEENDKRFYKDAKLDNEITQLLGKDKDILLDSEYKEQFLLYKHTFKQNSDGTFYWYSTMPVNR